jgi:hypothetical protein
MSKACVIWLLLIIIGCGKGHSPKLILTNDELVKAMVELYTINAALEIDDLTLRDSLSAVYLRKVADITGHSPEIIRNDFDKLILMPDSLLMIQGRALDTLRILTDRVYSPSTLSIGLQ